MNIEELARDVKLAELAIAKECVLDRDRKIEQLQLRIELLESMLNRLSALQGGLPQPQPLPSLRPTPRRWSVR